MRIAAPPYVGNGHYCYANTTAMLLASIGARIGPDLVEVLSGVGLGALWLRDQELFFFGVGAPDQGITRALDLLGFEVTERSASDADPPPYGELAAALETGPALLGPLDIGLLTYVAGRGKANGVDHFVLAYALDDAEVHVHDPAGFPHVSLPRADLGEAWRAERVGYRRGAFRWWAAPRQVRDPTARDMVERAQVAFRGIYRQADAAAGPEMLTGSRAIRVLADVTRHGSVSPRLYGHMVGFLFQVAARRALDYAAFFDDSRADLADIKREQAVLFGRCHTLAVRRDWSGLGGGLVRLADLEDQFRDALHAA